jgi:microcystin-dependent protein
MPRYNRLSTILVQPSSSEVGLKDTFTQPGHALQAGAAVYVDSSGNLQPGNASSVALSKVIGIVESINGNDVTVVYQGEVNFASGITSSFANFPLVTGDTYYLSSSITGGITNGYNTENTSSVIKPVMVPLTSYSGVVVNALPLSTTPLVSLFSPVGSIVPFVGSGSNIPAGWVLCAGDSLAKSGSYYDSLYDIIGEKYSIKAIANSSNAGLTASIKFDGSIYDPPTEGPGSNKNHSVENNDVYKMVWGSNQTIVRIYSATGSTHNVTLTYLNAITGSTSFNSLSQGTEVTLKSLVDGEATGYTSDKFFLPDLRGRSIVGAGTGRGLSNRSIGDVGGEEAHALTENELPSHNHAIQILSSTGVSGSASYLIGATSGNVTSILSSYPQAQSAFTSATGGGDDHENMSPFAVANWIIRYKTNQGQPGIEVGPRGAKGSTGDKGPTGIAGPTGAIGPTGVGLGALNYFYTSVSSIPHGYCSFNSNSTAVSDELLLSSVEYSGAVVSDYITTVMNNNNTSRKAIAIIRSINEPTGFLRVYGVNGPYTIVNTTQSGNNVLHYKLSVNEVLSSLGVPATGDLYSVLLLPSANEGSQGGAGPQGVTGSVGQKGETGAQGVTGECGCTAPYYTKYNASTVYVSPAGDPTPDVASSSPHNISIVSAAPTNYDTFVESLSGTWGDLPSIEETQPLNVPISIKRNFKFSLQITSQACGGMCEGASGYISLCDTVRDPDSSNYFTPPKETNISLVKDSTNTVFNSDKTNVVSGCKVNIFASPDSYFTKIPVGLSAGFLNGSTGNTGRNTIVVDILMNTTNVVEGNYIGIRPEYFTLSLTASATGHQSIAGLYKVNTVTDHWVRAYGNIPFGISGADVFTGYITGGASGPFFNVDVYTTSVNFKDCSGYLVESGELNLGMPEHGDPFVISFEGLTNSSEAAKAVISTGSGLIKLGNNMAFYGWPSHGSALYAGRGGTIKSDNVIISNCSGAAVLAERNGIIELTSPVINGNTYGLVTKTYGVIEINGDLDGDGFTNIVNNSSIGILDTGTIQVEDSYSQFIANGYQAGFYFMGNSSLVVGGDERSGGLVGGTGQSSNFVGGSGESVNTVSPFLNVSPTSMGIVNMICGGGKLGTSVPSTSNLQSYILNTGKGKVSKFASTDISRQISIEVTQPLSVIQ